VTTDPDRLLSEFIDAWNAGRRPDAGSYLARAGPEAQADLAESIAAFVTWAPTPDYDRDALAAIAAEPIVLETLGAAREPAGLWPSLIARARQRAALTSSDLAAALARALELPARSEPKTRAYLEEMEAGGLDPAGVSRRLLAALARLLGLSADELEKQPTPAMWSVREALEHVMETEVALLAKLERWPASEFATLQAVHRMAFQRFAVMDPEDTAIDHEIQGRRWSTRKVMRRILEHEYEHLGHIKEIVAALGSDRPPE